MKTWSKVVHGRRHKEVEHHGRYGRGKATVEATRIMSYPGVGNYKRH